MQDGERPYKCETCDKTFAKTDDLNMHMRVHIGNKPHECEVCKEAFPTGHQLKEHSFKHTGGQTCKICRKLISNPGAFKLHRRKCIREKQLECKICKKSFSSVLQIKRHRRIHKKKVKRCECKVCGRSVASRYLKHHIEMCKQGNLPIRTCKGKRRYQCKFCKKLFKSLDELKMHKEILEREKRSECEVCGRSFCSSYLNKHLELHKQGNLPTRTYSGKKRYQCKVCEKPFYDTDCFKEHILTHATEKPYKRRIFWKSFSYSTSLQWPESSRTNVLLYKCEMCKISFLDRSTFESHAVIHMGQRPDE